jgi:SPP1 family predicted phage head-tail adaptor
MIDPGQLKTRLVVQQPIEAPDDQGGVVRNWTTFATVWAQVTPLAARRDVEADADGVTQAYRIVLRSHLSLTLQHRFSDGARIYRIVAIREREDRRLIEIDADVRIS